MHGCLKPVNTHRLDLVRHDGRFLAGRSTLELNLTAQYKVQESDTCCPPMHGSLIHKLKLKYTGGDHKIGRIILKI